VSSSEPRSDRPAPGEARALWRVCEPIHAVTYFAPEVRDALRAVGLRGFWMGYTAARVAPLGAIGPEIATAVLHNFAPDMVARSLPAAWSYATPSAVLEARSAALPAALAPFTGAAEEGVWAVPADLLERVVRAAPVVGRTLFAAHRELAWPDAPLLRLWHVATLLREHRGDGHVAALTAAGLSGLEAHVLVTGVRGTDPALLRDNRGWSVDDWDGATVALADRGLVDRTGVATAAGAALHADVEGATDGAAAGPLAVLTPEERSATISALSGIAQRIAATGLVPFPNPMGLPRP
jgi:hypothetical protein